MKYIQAQSHNISQIKLQPNDTLLHIYTVSSICAHRPLLCPHPPTIKPIIQTQAKNRSVQHLSGSLTKQSKWHKQLYCVSDDNNPQQLENIRLFGWVKKKKNIWKAMRSFRTSVMKVIFC